MLEWEGNMVDRKYKVQTIISKVEIDFTMVESADIIKTESNFYFRMKDI